MAIIGIFEDDHGLIPVDPGRMIFINNIPPAPPLPAIPSGVFQPPTPPIFLSILTPVYTQQLSYGSGVSILATFTFSGYTMSATYAFLCRGVSTTVSVPSIFEKQVISWYDKDKTPKGTPANPALLQIPLPLLTGNHSDNPHKDGTDIVVKLENGETYIIRGPAIALRNEIDTTEQTLVDMLESGAQCYYAEGDPDGFNNQ